MPHDKANSEWFTHKQQIDPLLDAIGWLNATRSLRGAYRIEEYETDNGPADYAFCCDSPVLRILLDRPRVSSTVALTELRDKLKQTRERFTPELLQKAHEAHYRKAPVDIIGMVKRAASDKEPLLTAQDRVGRAFDKLTAGKTFTPAQQQWLDRIRAHLVENLSIDREDFDVSPVLERLGGWTAADRVFKGKLAQWLREVNEAVAA